MSLAQVRDGICRWFGGPYDPPTRSYRTPQVSGLGVVRRARPKVDDEADYYVGQPATGSLVGSQMLVHVGAGVESHEAIAGAFGGLQQLTSTVTLHVFLRSRAEQAEDAQDAFYDLVEALKGRIRADRRMGTGGFEQPGGFQVGRQVRWRMDPAETTSEVTTAYLSLDLDVTYYEQGG